MPVFKYLASEDVDEVGFTLRTASLMSGPEAEFDAADPGDYAAFGVRFLILPAGMQPPVKAELGERRGTYSLWRIKGGGYVDVVDTRGRVTATSSDLGSVSAAFLAGLPPAHAVYATVVYGGARMPPGTLPPESNPSGSPGRVTSEHADLEGGTVFA